MKNRKEQTGDFSLPPYGGKRKEKEEWKNKMAIQLMVKCDGKDCDVEASCNVGIGLFVGNSNVDLPEEWTLNVASKEFLCPSCNIVVKVLNIIQAGLNDIVGVQKTLKGKNWKTSVSLLLTEQKVLDSLIRMEVRFNDPHRYHDPAVSLPDLLAHKQEISSSVKEKWGLNCSFYEVTDPHDDSLEEVYLVIEK